MPNCDETLNYSLILMIYHGYCAIHYTSLHKLTILGLDLVQFSLNGFAQVFIEKFGYCLYANPRIFNILRACYVAQVHPCLTKSLLGDILEFCSHDRIEIDKLNFFNVNRMNLLVKGHVQSRQAHFNPRVARSSLSIITKKVVQCGNHQMLENTLVWHYKHHTFTCIVVNLPKSTWFQNVSRDYYLGLNMCPTGQGINITWEGAHTLVGR